MSKFFTNARKITAARVAGTCTGAGIAAAITKDYAVVCPALALALAATVVIHRKLVAEDKLMEEAGNVTDVPVSTLAITGMTSAVEVGLVSVVASKLLGYSKRRFGGSTEVVVDVDVAVPADVAPVTPVV